MLLLFLQGVFTPINCFCFILQNTLCKIELSAESLHLFSNCCFGYGVMELFSTAQRVLFAKTFWENGKCATQIVQQLQTIFGRKQAPCESTVCTLMTKFETIGSVLMVKSPGQKRFCQTEEQLVLVLVFMKFKVYAEKPCTILQLQAEIKHVIKDIGPQICEKVISNFEKHKNAFRLSAGGHMPNVVFHM